MEMTTFNMKDGYAEAILRGYKGVLLNSADYALMCQCENLDDLKMHLSTTSYGNLGEVDSDSNATAQLIEHCTAKFVEEFEYLQCQSEGQLYDFLDMCRIPHMIDNVVLIVSGCLHNQHTPELLEKCHPLGMFDAIASLAVASNMQELYQLVLIDTPLGKYFEGSLSKEDLTEMHLEIMRNMLYKCWIEDFQVFCNKVGGTTKEMMSTFLSFEADRRAISITLNSVGTELTHDDKRSLFCNLGSLYPYGHQDLAPAEDFDQIVKVVSEYAPYNLLLSVTNPDEEQMVDEILLGHELSICREAFSQQFHYGVFWAYIKMKEQEIRNLMWISECIVQNMHSRIHDGVKF
jgi:V-type H+-transporting ATPase subunit d